jgi:hypothetical protein
LILRTVECVSSAGEESKTEDNINGGRFSSARSPSLTYADAEEWSGRGKEKGRRHANFEFADLTLQAGVAQLSASRPM